MGVLCVLGVCTCRDLYFEAHPTLGSYLGGGITLPFALLWVVLSSHLPWHDVMTITPSSAALATCGLPSGNSVGRVAWQSLALCAHCTAAVCFAVRGVAVLHHTMAKMLLCFDRGEVPSADIRGMHERAAAGLYQAVTLCVTT